MLADCSAAVVPRGLRQLPRRVHRSACHVALSRVGSPAAGLTPRPEESAAPNGRSRAATAGFSRATCKAPPRPVPMSNRPLDLSVSAVGPPGLPCRPQVNGYTLGGRSAARTVAHRVPRHRRIDFLMDRECPVRSHESERRFEVPCSTRLQFSRKQSRSTCGS